MLAEITMQFDEQVYLPENSIQGEDIPLYIKWDKNKKITIKIILPAGLELKELFNVPDGGYYDVKDINETTINDFEINGYLGAVLSSQQYLYASNNSKIVIEIHCDDNVTVVEKHIELFRQDLGIIHKPEEISIIFNENTNKFLINNKIRLKNKGNGKITNVFKKYFLLKYCNLTSRPSLLEFNPESIC